MKFAIIINDLSTIVPTTANFEQCILMSLNRLNTKHEVFIFTFSDVKNNDKLKGLNFKFININDFEVKIKYLRLRLLMRSGVKIFLKLFRLSNKIKLKNLLDSISPLNKALAHEKIDLVWQPFCMHHVDIPFVLNCLDVNYRINPFLPEERMTAQEWYAYNISRLNIMQRATYLITSTTSGKHELMNYFGIAEERIRRIPFFTPKIEGVNFTDNQLGEIDPATLPKKFLFYPARIIPHKNHITILLALKHLKEVHNTIIDFVFVGQDKGNLSYVKQKIAEFNLTESTHYYGSVSFKDLNYLYSKAFALVYASINGPDNLPPLEAFDLGCPVIASNLSGSAEQFEDCALVFEKLDYKQLGEQILHLLKDDGLRQELIVKGKKRADSWTADHYVNDVLKIVDDYQEYARLWDGVNYKHNW